MVRMTNHEWQSTLAMVLNQIIPPSSDGRMPGAADVDFLAFAENQGSSLWIRDGLEKMQAESHIRFQRGLVELHDPQAVELMGIVARTMRVFFNRLSHLVIQCYYQHDRVLAAIGVERRTPFPKGYTVDEGDLTLLEDVFNRGKIYRDGHSVHMPQPLPGPCGNGGNVAAPSSR